MNTESKELRKCSQCGCKKLLKFFKVRQSTGELYKTCIKCCEKSIKGHKKCACENLNLILALKTMKNQLVVKFVNKPMIDIKNKKCPCGKRTLFSGLKEMKKQLVVKIVNRME
jgi:hypothetical protein